MFNIVTENKPKQIQNKSHIDLVSLNVPTAPQGESSERDQCLLTTRSETPSMSPHPYARARAHTCTKTHTHAHTNTRTRTQTHTYCTHTHT